MVPRKVYVYFLLASSIIERGDLQDIRSQIAPNGTHFEKKKIIEPTALGNCRKANIRRFQYFLSLLKSSKNRRYNHFLLTKQKKCGNYFMFSVVSSSSLQIPMQKQSFTSLTVQNPFRLGVPRIHFIIKLNHQSVLIQQTDFP